MTEARPSREELEAKAKELAGQVFEAASRRSSMNPLPEVGLLFMALLSVAREAREDAVERCAKIAEERAATWDGKMAYSTVAACHEVAFFIRESLKPEEPDE